MNFTLRAVPTGPCKPDSVELIGSPPARISPPYNRLVARPVAGGVITAKQRFLGARVEYALNHFAERSAFSRLNSV